MIGILFLGSFLNFLWVFVFNTCLVTLVYRLNKNIFYKIFTKKYLPFFIFKILNYMYSISRDSQKVRSYEIRWEYEIREGSNQPHMWPPPLLCH